MEIKPLTQTRPVNTDDNFYIESSRRKRRWRRAFFILFWLVILSPFIAMGVMLKLAGNGSFGELPTLNELENPKSLLATEVYSSDGEVLGRYFRQNRTNVNYEEISPYLIDALIATEDERFYQHSGIDGRALARAAYRMGSAGGGSTITQQLAKMLFHDEGYLSKMERVEQKFQEWIIATEIEKHYTKEEILAMYFNKFDFLHQAVGVKSAAKIYFNKTPDSLKMEEAALLAGMAQNPIRWNPRSHPEAAMHRREVVLKQWLVNSEKDNPNIKNRITVAEYDSLRQLPIVLDFQLVNHKEGLAPYFREILRKEVTSILKSKDDKGNLKYPDASGKAYDIYQDGLKIYTTIDSRMQKYAEYAVQEHLRSELQKDFDKNNANLKNWPFSDDIDKTIVNNILRRSKKVSHTYKRLKAAGKSEKEITEFFNTPRKMKVFTWKNSGMEKDTVMSPMDSMRYYKSFLRTGMVSIDPHTGFVKAWVGGPNFKHFQYDHVKQGKRQVGSTFKPFVYASLFRFNRAMQPCTEIIDQEYCIDVWNEEGGKDSWCPQNSGPAFDHKMMTLKYGLASSRNSVTAYAMSQTSPQAVRQLAGDMGINTKNMLAVPSMALGVFDVNVLEMTGAYCTFANNGVNVKPVIVSRIEDLNGNIIYDVDPEMKTALDEVTNYKMLDILKAVVDGTPGRFGRSTAGTARRLRGGSRPYAKLYQKMGGKTGTTQNQSDGWYMGVTPDLVTGVWVGAEDRSVRFNDIKFGMGSNMALPIFGYYMNKVYEDKEINLTQEDFKIPPAARELEFDCSKIITEDGPSGEGQAPPDPW